VTLQPVHLVIVSADVIWVTSPGPSRGLVVNMYFNLRALGEQKRKEWRKGGFCV